MALNAPALDVGPLRPTLSRPRAWTLWTLPWLALIGVIAGSADRLRVAVGASPSPAARELPEVALTGALATAFFTYALLIGVALLIARGLDRWLTAHARRPVAQAPVLTAVSLATAAILGVHALVVLGPGAPGVPLGLRIAVAAIGVLGLAARLHFTTLRESGVGMAIAAGVAGAGVVTATALSL